MEKQDKTDSLEEQKVIDRKKYDREMDTVRKEQMDQIAGYMADNIKRADSIRTMKITGSYDEESLKRVESMEIPRKGRDAKIVGDEMVRDIFSNGMVLQHPRFFSFVASAVSPYSVAGSMLTDLYNPYGGSYQLAPAAGLVEEKLIKWMAGKIGYEDTDKAGGVFLSGGSMSNFSAQIAARNNKLKETEYPIGVAYVSDQTHSSLAKGLKMIGLRKDQIVIIPSDDDFRLRADLLEEAIENDKKEGRKPFMVIGTVATTNTGSIDPLEEIAEICEKHDLWFHVDGAYGGSILISDIYRNLAKGIEKADSVSWDWHKWALQVYSCSCLIVKNRQHLLDAFVEHPEYLADVSSSDHCDGWDLGPEMSRPHRSLKLWYTLQAMGTDLLADVIDYAFFNSKKAEKMIRELSGWELTSSASCGTITFRYAPEGFDKEKLDEINGEISRTINEDGFAYIVTTTIKGKRVLRMCMINGNTTTEDVISTIECLDNIAKRIC